MLETPPNYLRIQSTWVSNGAHFFYDAGDSEVVRTSGRRLDSKTEIQTGSPEGFETEVALYAENQSSQRLNSDISLPLQDRAEELLVICWPRRTADSKYILRVSIADCGHDHLDR